MSSTQRATFVLLDTGHVAAQLRSVCGNYGQVQDVSNSEVAVRAVMAEPSLTAAIVSWSKHNRCFLDRVVAECGGIGTPILVLCCSPSSDVVLEVFRAQEQGLNVRLACVPISDADLRRFIENCIGETTVPHLKPDMMAHARSQGEQMGLTQRELQVLSSAVAGSERPQILRTLQIAPSTLRSHVRAILGKFENRYPARNLTELVNVLMRGAVRSTDADYDTNRDE